MKCVEIYDSAEILIVSSSLSWTTTTHGKNTALLPTESHPSSFEFRTLNIEEVPLLLYWAFFYFFIQHLILCPYLFLRACCANSHISRIPLINRSGIYKILSPSEINPTLPWLFSFKKELYGKWNRPICTWYSLRLLFFCATQAFLFKVTTPNWDGSISVISSIPCNAGSSLDICIVQVGDWPNRNWRGLAWRWLCETKKERRKGVGFNAELIYWAGFAGFRAPLKTKQLGFVHREVHTKIRIV